jgi:hypothetical protein
LRNDLGGENALVVTAKDLRWRDTETCRVDVRAFDREREAALAAATTDDSEEVLAHATAAVNQYRGELLPGGFSRWATWLVLLGRKPLRPVSAVLVGRSRVQR